jgi:two-component sensor histidine kinase
VVAEFNSVEDARALAQAIVDTVREPLLVLDRDLRVVAASRSFYSSFEVDRDDVLGRLLYQLGDEQWDIPALRTLLEKIIPEHTAMDAFEIEHLFPSIGHRIMLLNAREVFYVNSTRKSLLLAFEDVTAKRMIERQNEELLRQTKELLRQKDVLLQEMEHRIANSLQIIASILMLKARSVTSEETRLHLQDAHKRVMSVAVAQQHLHTSNPGELIEIGPYLSKLCGSLAASMIGDDRPISLQVACDDGGASSATAVSLGLIVTELVINALKHAFPKDRRSGEIIVSYEVNGRDWMLVVSDNGIGKSNDGTTEPKRGLGTSIVNALADQLYAQVAVISNHSGMKVSVTHATFTSRQAA